MKNKYFLYLLAASTLTTPAVHAYELATHGLLTLAAFQISSLGGTTLQNRLGIDVYTLSPDHFICLVLGQDGIWRIDGM